jgi:2-polyprenyl-6-methoxyphenol hydroxylase-like FAD-dependent oxidoreductase
MRRTAFVLQASSRPLRPQSLALRRLSSEARPSSTQRNVEVDVCIVGGGIVGSCVAAALKRAPRTCDAHSRVPVVFLSPCMINIPLLRRRHLRIALIDSSWPTRLTGLSPHTAESSAQSDQQRPLPSESASARDRRVYAISPASRQLLQAVGAWQLLPADCAHNYDSMQVCTASTAGHSLA